MTIQTHDTTSYKNRSDWYSYVWTLKDGTDSTASLSEINCKANPIKSLIISRLLKFCLTMTVTQQTSALFPVFLDSFASIMLAMSRSPEKSSLNAGIAPLLKPKMKCCSFVDDEI